MTRYTIEVEGSPISVAYGYDEINGIFLAVTDERLEYDENAADPINQVTESIGVKDGGGSYFDLHTGDVGFGLKVSESTMLVYLKRYGVSEKQIKQVLEDKKRSESSKCAHVSKKGTKQENSASKLTETVSQFNLKSSQKKEDASIDLNNNMITTTNDQVVS
jgi:hypothetical protein